MPIAWDPRLLTGDEMIDAQHRCLFDLAAALERECADGCDVADRTADAVCELVEYVLEHFRDEEELMERSRFPASGPHRAQHQYLAGRTLAIAAECSADGGVHPETLARFVAEWLTDHILAEDMRLAEHVRTTS